MARTESELRNSWAETLVADAVAEANATVAAIAAVPEGLLFCTSGLWKSVVRATLKNHSNVPNFAARFAFGS